MMLLEISEDLTDEQMAQLGQSLADVEAILAFPINLTPRERKSLQTMGDRSLPFVEKTVEIASANPDLVPEYLKVDRLNRYFELSNELFSVLSKLSRLREKAEDARYVAGAQSLAWARKFYRYLKVASVSGVPGTDAFVQELSKRYHQKPRKPEEQPESPPQ
jgi:hypothetical protein